MSAGAGGCTSPGGGGGNTGCCGAGPAGGGGGGSGDEAVGVSGRTMTRFCDPLATLSIVPDTGDLSTVLWLIVSVICAFSTTQ